MAVENLSLEILVGDDSMERSAQPVVASLADRQITYVAMNPPTGGYPGRVRNHLARMARGKYLYFLDDDDRVNPIILPNILKSMTKKGAHIAVCDVSPFGENGPSLVHEKNYFLNASRTLSQQLSPEVMVAWLLFKDPLLVTSACVITRDAFTELGGFDETLSHFEDTELFLRAIRDFGYLYIPSPIVERRCGQVSLSRSLTNKQIAGFYRRIRKKYQHIHGTREFTTLRLCAAFASRPKKRILV
jgi:GT2 family glycosyltransferase